ncbi:hypothetical protein BDW62DRAFT_119907 [Aspergillus aurantiobrunneus]
MALRDRTLAVAALATISSANPLVYSRDGRGSNVTYAFTNPNGLNFTQMNTTLPNVSIFATGTPHPVPSQHHAKSQTGGTVAGSVNSAFYPAIYKLILKDHFPIVRSTRTGNGEVPCSEFGGISSGFLSLPQGAHSAGVAAGGGPRGWAD